jgi:hypothetical protein
MPSTSARSWGWSAAAEWIVSQGRERRLVPRTVMSICTATCLPELPEHGGVAMAHERTLSAREDGRHPAPSAVDGTQGIDPAVQALEPSVGDPPMYRGRTQPERDQPPVGDDPVPPNSEPGNDGVEQAHRSGPGPFAGGGIRVFARIAGTKSITPPEGGGEMRARGAGSETKGWRGRDRCPTRGRMRWLDCDRCPTRRRTRGRHDHAAAVASYFRKPS